jgi:hypothetical protein
MFIIRRGMSTLFSVLTLSLILPLAAGAAELGQRLDAEVTTSSGDKKRLKAYYGKPVLLFYEDLESVKLNQPAKEALGKLAVKWNLTDKIDVVAVANLEGFNWQPASFIALMAIRGEEKKAGVPVLADFTGALERAPWKLEASASSILLLGPDGEVLFESRGFLEKEKYEALVAALEKVLSTQVVAVIR